MSDDENEMIYIRVSGIVQFFLLFSCIIVNLSHLISVQRDSLARFSIYSFYLSTPSAAL